MSTLSDYLWPLIKPSDTVPNPPRGPLITYSTWNPFFYLLLFGILPVSSQIDQFIRDPLVLQQYIFLYRQIAVVGLCGMIGVFLIDMGTRRKSKPLFSIGIALLLLTLVALLYAFYALITFLPK
jgi:hypothetical protein